MPIINPIWFYLMDVVDKVWFVSVTFMVICVVASFVGMLFYYDEYTDEETKDKISGCKNKTAVIFFITLLISVFMPSQDTMMKMLVSKNITHERVEMGQEALVETVDYIFEKLNELNGGE